MENKPTLIIVGSDKGGVGKTTVSRLLIDYLKAHNVPSPLIFDTEPGEGNLRRFFPEAKSIDVLTVSGQMQIFDNIQSYTLLDLKANSLSAILLAMKNAGSLKDVANGSMRLCVFHVLGSSIASLREIQAMEEILKEGGEHFLVQNHSTDGLFFAEDPELQKKYFETSKKLLIIPHLDGTAADAVDKAGVSFRDYIKNSTNDKKITSWLGKQVAYWMSLVDVELDKAKIL